MYFETEKLFSIITVMRVGNETGHEPNLTIIHCDNNVIFGLTFDRFYKKTIIIVILYGFEY